MGQPRSYGMELDITFPELMQWRMSPRCKVLAGVSRQWLHVAITQLILVEATFCQVEHIGSPVICQGICLFARDATVIRKFSFCEIIMIIIIAVCQRELQKCIGKI